MNVPDTQIAVTLFNLRDHCKTPDDLDKTLERIHGFGYRAIQVSGCALDPKIIREKMDKYGLFCCATHEGIPAYKNEFDRIVEKMKTIGCDFTALGSPGDDYFVPGGAEKLADEMSEIGGKFRKHGIKLGFHNHHRELGKYGSKKTFLEIFYERSDRQNVFAEIDVHWITRGGGSPTDWIHRVAGRMPVVHFKDFAFVKGEPRFCEVGEGNLDWPSILKACRDTNIRWYSIEQDNPVEERDIFASVKLSFDNLRAMGVK
jgi:sugar phosphate isomerase/epimerase